MRARRSLFTALALVWLWRVWVTRAICRIRRGFTAIALSTGSRKKRFGIATILGGKREFILWMLRRHARAGF